MTVDAKLGQVTEVTLNGLRKNIKPAIVFSD